MAFARWDPIGDLLALQHRVDRFVTGPAGWKPPVDLLETGDQYVITAELPGLTRDDVNISIHDGHLTLSGSRLERTLPCDAYHRVERGYGQFSRTFQLPAAVETDRITADLRDGVLTVVIPKAQDPGRRIPVT